MPDGDIIHPTLNRRFQNVYGQMCEGHWEPSVLGHRILNPLKKQLQEYGNAPVSFGQDIIPILEQANSYPETGRKLSFADFSDKIMDLSKSTTLNCSPRGRDLMIEAAKKTLVKIQHEKVPPGDVESILFNNYIDTVYKKDFEDRIQETPMHHKDASPLVITELMEDMRPYVYLGRDVFARQIIKTRDVSKLRRPNRLKEPPPAISDEAW